MNEVGYIYILTNPSFKGWVKIGYADDVNKRLHDLNSTQCTPFAFRIYATYKTAGRLKDKKVHELIDTLNSSLRSRDILEDGKERVREFYQMSPEEAFEILASIASINGLEGNLVKHKKSKEEQREEADANKARLSSFRFSYCNLKPGDKIHFIDDSSIVCTIVDDRHVLYNDETYSLSALASALTKKKSLAGPHYFTYNGKKLCTLRDELHPEDND